MVSFTVGELRVRWGGSLDSLPFCSGGMIYFGYRQGSLMVKQLHGKQEIGSSILPLGFGGDK